MPHAGTVRLRRYTKRRSLVEGTRLKVSFRAPGYSAPGCTGLGGGTRTAFGAGGAKAKNF
jgi:hypothetical protein